MCCDLISVVVPIYKVEQYLSACVDSILNQTYRNLEIILVDDGSPDPCPKICDEYGKKDPRVRVIHKENGGLSDARNYGIDAATGKYISFVDSDDIIKSNFIECLYKAVMRCGAQMACCGFIPFNDGLQPDLQTSVQAELFEVTGKTLIEGIYAGQHDNIAFTAWNKLYAVDLFKQNHIYYPKGKLHEDNFVTYQLMYFSAKIAVIGTPLYLYRLRKGSITNTSISSDRCRDGVEADSSAVFFFHDKNEEILARMALNSFCKSTTSTYWQVLCAHSEPNCKENRQILCDKFSQVWRKYHKLYSLGFAKNMLYGIFDIWPGLTAFLIGWKK